MTGRERAAWPAPAKLNLFLRILGRRPDGLHELQTVFQLLDWGDELLIEPTGEAVIMRLAEIDGVPPEQDLSLRAARLLQAECEVGQGARIQVRKRIPQGAGLGGASSDAATVLVALNHLWGCGLAPGELAELGLRLGADVPLFVLGHSAWAEGVGERLTPVSLGRRYYVLVFPGLHVSTAAIFADPELPRHSAPLDPAATPDFDALGNDCAAVVLQRYPQLRELASELTAHGRPRMTGTGSTLFLRAASPAQAAQLTTSLKSRYNVRAVGGVDRSPLLQRLASG